MRNTIDNLLRHHRPELWETWQHEATLDSHLDRLCRIATDLHNEAANDRSSISHPPTSNRPDHDTCLRAVWLATEDDWEAAQMALEAGDETSAPPSPPSNWYTPLS